jgi:TubC N-terminal docking domain
MILSWLLTKLLHVGVRLTVVQGRLKVHAPAGVLTEELRQAMTEQKAALLQFAQFPYVETIDGLGMLTGNTQERDLFCVAEERQEALRYRIGVVSLYDGVERFSYPRMVLVTRPEMRTDDKATQEEPS